MPRKTKEQLRAEQEAENQQRIASEAAEYPSLLMYTLELMQKHGHMYRLEIENKEFVVVGLQSYPEKHTLGYAYTRESYDTLISLSWDMHFENERERQRAEEYLERKAALSKLTERERMLLEIDE